MFRIVCAAVLCTTLLAGSTRGADDFTVGRNYEGKIPNEEISIEGWPTYNDTYTARGCKLEVTLKDEQMYKFDVTLRDPKQILSVALLDPTGAVVAASKRHLEKGTVKLEYKAVVTGNFTLVVMSDKVTNFTLRSTGPASKTTLADLEAKRKRLQAELDAVNSQIEALKKK